MAAIIDETERKEREQALEILEEQIGVERKLINLYEQTINETDNKPIQRMLRMIRTDSMKHVEMLQSAQELIRGAEILIADRQDLTVNLLKHIALEKSSIEKGDKLLAYSWIRTRKGLHVLLEHWRSEEKRHHKFLKTLSEKPYIPMNSDDFVTIFRDEEFLEERYLRSKRLQEKYPREEGM